MVDLTAFVSTVQPWTRNKGRPFFAIVAIPRQTTKNMYPHIPLISQQPTVAGKVDVRPNSLPFKVRHK